MQTAFVLTHERSRALGLTGVPPKSKSAAQKEDFIVAQRFCHRRYTGPGSMA
jgi:hypothetical protein